MKTYYCVTTTFDDRGQVTAAITASMSAVAKPKNTFTETAKCDVYTDWFASRARADAYVHKSLSA